MEIRLKENLKRLLTAKGMKAADLSRLTGVAPSVISEWMAGRMPRNLNNLQKIALGLGIPLGDLCFGKPEITKNPPGGDNGPRRGRPTKTKDIFPLMLPINESGVLEFHVRWTSLKKAEEIEKSTRLKEPR